MSNNLNIPTEYHNMTRTLRQGEYDIKGIQRCKFTKRNEDGTYRYGWLEYLHDKQKEAKETIVGKAKTYELAEAAWGTY